MKTEQGQKKRKVTGKWCAFRMNAEEQKILDDIRLQCGLKRTTVMRYLLLAAKGKKIRIQQTVKVE